jgi:fumarylpyruvate hydrolase
MGAISREAPAPDAPITLSVNGSQRQSGRLSDMIWSIPEVIAEASRLWTLAPGDLIFTGTPEGVGPIARGERVEARITGLPSLAFTLK